MAKEVVFSPEEKEALLEIINDPLLYVESNLKIVSKMGQLIPFLFNRQQYALYREIERQRQIGQPVRIIILKARQLGFSTAVAGLFYQWAATHEHVSAMIIAHDANASANIFKKIKTFYDNSHPALAPMVQASNARELVFANGSNKPLDRKKNPGLDSKIRIDTAMSETAGRAATIHLLHVSELAFWPHAEETMRSVLQTVPQNENTMVIVESTANGVGNHFWDMWQRAVRGENEFVPLFFPWHKSSEYVMNPPPGYALTEEEQELKEKFSLTDGQIVWRRWAIKNNTNGDLDAFHQEYPMTAEEAFIASGRPVFDVDAIQNALINAPKPKETGRVQETLSGVDRRVGFQSMYNGYLKIWEFPKDGEEYVIGVDTAAGKASGDFSCIQVINRRTKEQAAEWHGHIDPDELGREASYLGRFYNLALIVPENNGVGLGTITGLRRYRYPRIYRNIRQGKTEDRNTVDYGFNTNVKTKPLIIGTLSRIIREGAVRIKSDNALRECITYVFDDEGKTNAQPGCHDDRVMALALAYQAIEQRQYAEPGVMIKEEPVEDLYGVNPTTGY